jgi:hypothetical protein
VLDAEKQNQEQKDEHPELTQTAGDVLIRFSDLNNNPQRPVVGVLVSNRIRQRVYIATIFLGQFAGVRAVKLFHCVYSGILANLCDSGFGQFWHCYLLALALAGCR